MTSMWNAPLRRRWRAGLRADHGQARFLTRESLRWVMQNRAYTPWYLVRYFRLLRFKMANPHIILRGMVFLGKNVEIHSTPELARMEIGRWVHIGDGNSIRCHEGSLRIGDKVVFGQNNVVNAYLDIEIGASTLIADWVLHLRLRPQDGRHHRGDQGPGHRQGSGARRPGHLDRDQGLGAAQHDRRTWLRAGSARRGEGHDPGLLDRGRVTGPGGQEPQGRLGLERRRSVPNSSARWPTSNARRLRRRRMASAEQ